MESKAGDQVKDTKHMKEEIALNVKPRLRP